MRRIAYNLLAGLLGTALVAADPAMAQTCFTLQAELTHLESRGGGGARYDRAWREQANVMARTEQRARDAGCFGGGFIFRRQPARSCRTLVQKLRQMDDNLVRLDRLRRRGGNGGKRRIRTIRNMMADRGCGTGIEEARAPRRGERIFDGADPWGRGTYRTLCVRTCDGYYFPISFSTTRQQFAKDAETCSAMCPGAESRLFYHANPGGSPEDMISIFNEPYASLETAFKYRTSIDSSCSCRPAGSYSVAADPGGRPPLDALVDPTPPLPRPRQPPGEDPETLANRAGGFDPRPRSANTIAVAAGGVDALGNPIRVVGPTVGTTPEQDEIILTPVPN